MAQDSLACLAYSAPKQGNNRAGKAFLGKCQRKSISVSPTASKGVGKELDCLMLNNSQNGHSACRKEGAMKVKENDGKQASLPTLFAIFCMTTKNSTLFTAQFGNGSTNNCAYTSSRRTKV